MVADPWVDNWDAANALKLMENILTAQSTKIDAVVASNDGTAPGALQAMKAQGLAGTVPISGQDATADGSNSIVKGELTVSILKNIRNLAPLAVELADKLLTGQTVDGLKNFSMADLTNDTTKKGEVPCLFGCVAKTRRIPRPASLGAQGPTGLAVRRPGPRLLQCSGFDGA